MLFKGKTKTKNSIFRFYRIGRLKIVQFQTDSMFSIQLYNYAINAVLADTIYVPYLRITLGTL